MRGAIREFHRILDLKTENSSVWSVHDSFGTHASNIDLLNRIVKSEFVRLHRGKDLDDWLDDFYMSEDMRPGESTDSDHEILTQFEFKDGKKRAMSEFFLG